jgi:tetratricopeptide (TPR) repeat protein
VTSERWQRIKLLFERALDEPPATRDAFLEESGESPSIVAEVRKLIAVDAQAGNFLDAGSLESSVGPLSPMDLVSGQFRIVGVLGRGGMGVVYQAEDLVLSRPVALKFVPGRLSGTTHGRLKREARAAAALNHPNICVVYETGEHQGQPFIVMELLQGQTLRQRILAGPLQAEELLDWAVQIASGLEAAHQAGIVHRDVKPANIFITTRGQAKILDFGLAKVAAPSANPATSPADANLTIPGMAIGTVPYMSPEQARGEPLDVRTDLFSFGAVLSEMATGKQAFTGATTAIIHEAILTRSPPPAGAVNAQIPPDLKRIIDKALQKDRELRYQDAAELRADLQRVKEDLAPHATRESRRGVAYRLLWSTRARRLVLTAAAALAALVVVSGWLWLHRAVSVAGDHHEIVLADFEIPAGDTEFDSALNTALAIDLKQSPFLLVASGGKTRETLKLMERSPQEKLTPALAREVCERINDQAVLSGMIARFGQKYLVTLTASDCATGADLAQSKAVANDRDSLLKAVDSVAAEMRKRLGEPLKSLERFNKPLLPKQTGSLEALKTYSRAHELGMDGKYQESIPFFQRAIELDPRFAVAYADLGVIFSNLGESDLAIANCRKAYELRDLANEPDRLFIVAAYHDKVTGDLNESIRNYETWTEIYPDDASPRGNLANLQTQIGRPDLAIAPAAKALALDPRVPVSYVILARAQMRVGQTDQALATCQRAVAQKLEGAEVHASLLQLAFARHDPSAVADQIAWAKGKSDEPYMRLQEALIDFAQGKRRAALETYRRSINGFKKQGMLEIANRVQGMIPRIEAELGLIDDARTLLHSLPPINGSTDIPAAMAEVGESSQAEAILRQEMQRFPDDTLWQDVRGPQIRCAIAMYRRKPEEAIEALRPGLPYDMRSFTLPAMRGRAYLAARQPSLAAVEFRKIIDHPTVEPLSHDLPLAHLGLARAYALLDDVANSKDEYEKFFALWKDADADLPVLKDARVEYTRLRR